MAALLGQEVLTKDYETVRIRIAFHPVEERFEVSQPGHPEGRAWIPDVATALRARRQPDRAHRRATRQESRGRSGPAFAWCSRRSRKIINNHVGLIELAEDLDIETVTEIFIRVNSAGAELSPGRLRHVEDRRQRDLWRQLLRKAIDYFCHLAVAPEFLPKHREGRQAFAASEFLPKMRWLKDVNDDLYDPTYTDMLRVAFTSEFGRGKLQDWWRCSRAATSRPSSTRKRSPRSPSAS